MTALNRELAARGFHRRPTARLLAELALFVALGAGGAVAFLVVPGIPAKAAALVAMTLGNLGMTTHTHSSSHNATSRRLWVNKALTLFGYGVWFGASAHYWWNKHVAVHHATPNVVGLDDDVDLLPWFALTPEEFQSGGPVRRWYYRHQWVVVPLAVALTTLNMIRASWAFLVPVLRDPRRRTRLHWIDLAAVTSHSLFWIGLPLLWFPAGQVAVFYLLRSAFTGYAVFATAAPAHFPVEAKFLPTEGHGTRGEYRRHSDYVLLQTVTTVNYRTGWLGTLLCCGAQYQLEHHLFPGISHPYYPRISPLLRRWCQENGYPYRTLGWWEGIWKTFRVFKHPKPVEPALEALRERVRMQLEAEPAGAGA
ncbi:MAG TPA: acyl-CoA desaturase [Longimicrobium sp.]